MRSIYLLLCMLKQVKPNFFLGFFSLFFNQREFPGRPVIERLKDFALQYGGCGFSLLWGAKMPHTLQPKNQNVEQKQHGNRNFKIASYQKIFLKRL